MKCIYLSLSFIFFFNQKTAYELRISDWSSDVCSSDLIALIWAIFARDLPSVDQLRDYEPPLPTMVRDGQGKPVHAYARERRVQLDYSEYPQLLVRSFLAAEDKTFFSHGGIDYPGIASAIVTNLTSSGRPIGASTITQQVAKHLLLKIGRAH